MRNFLIACQSLEKLLEVSAFLSKGLGPLIFEQALSSSES
jgi:hypothetical protein